MDISAISNDICVILGIAISVFSAKRFIHMLQLEGYQNNMYLKWLRRNTVRDWVPTMLVFVICALLDAALPFGAQALGSVLSANMYVFAQVSVRVIYIVLMLYIAYTWSTESAKKPLVLTGRAKRLFATETLIVVFINLYAYALEDKASDITAYIFMRAAMYLPALLLPLTVLIANVINYPIEEGIKRWYYNDAKKKLAARTDVIIIGITGSYGKTSTKFTLGTLLNEKFNTLITPASYNTPMGVTRTIREKLAKENEVFVAEMGARYTGEIDELCDLVSPQIGILTSVGKQHLETFGSQENITNTKFELIAALPENGAAFFNADNEICRELYERKVAVANKYLYGIDSRDELYMRATEIVTTPRGCEFTLLSRKGETIFCKTTLLGRHNVLNMTGCAAVARYMGLSMEQIAAGIAKLKPVEHRLQLIEGAVTVIDDAFNSNPEGAAAALDVLSSFSGKRIIITPGMVELGKDEYALNERFGRQIAQSADYAILVGQKRTEPIAAGLKAEGFPESCIIITSSLDEATKMMSELTEQGDTVLFENDLPDNYSE